MYLMLSRKIGFVKKYKQKGLLILLNCFQYPFEALFRSEQYALVDNACREYLFVSEFFMVRGQQALDLFNQIMGKTTGLLKVFRNKHSF